MNEANLIIGIVSAFIGILAGAIGIKRTFKNDIKEESNSQTRFEMQLNYISRGVDDIKLDIKMQDNKINGVIERVAKVEESAKSAHKRYITIGYGTTFAAMPDIFNSYNPLETTCTKDQARGYLKSEAKNCAETIK